MRVEKRKELNRLRRIEGQVRAVVRMVEQEREDSSIDVQLRAIQSAIHSLRLARLENKILLNCERGQMSNDVCEKILGDIHSFFK